MTNYRKVGELRVEDSLYALVNHDMIPGTGVDERQFWLSVQQIFSDFAPLNKKLLGVRDQLHPQIDAWHLSREGQPHDAVGDRARAQEPHRQARLPDRSRLRLHALRAGGGTAPALVRDRARLRHGAEVEVVLAAPRLPLGVVVELEHRLDQPAARVVEPTLKRHRRRPLLSV